MQFAGASTHDTTIAVALDELIAGVESIPHPDLLCLFFTSHWNRFAPALATSLGERLGPRVLLGASAESVAGPSEEIEREPGVAILAASLPNVTLRPFHITAEEWRPLLNDDERFQQRVGAGSEHRCQIVIGDPFSTPVDALLTRLDQWMRAPTIGGMASAGQSPGSNVLILNDTVADSGAIGFGVGGPVAVNTVVSQGCRPVGEPMVVTKADGGLIQELGRKPAIEVAEGILNRLSPSERELLRNGVFVGVAIDEYREKFGTGDFLVRGLLGVDKDRTGLAVGDRVRPGQTVQFHLRDAESAHQELVSLLQAEREWESAGGLLFTCNGRGTRMFDTPHHDVRTVRDVLPGAVVAGMFAMGEIGPIGGRSFMHGHTASLALFRPLTV